VNRLDAPAQEHLLSALDRNMVQGTGARVISSSAQPLDSLVAQNRFHAALFHHLAGVRVAIPALRERPGDIPELFRIFVQEHATDAAVNLPVPSDRLLHALASYRWPGNGLELSNLAATFAVSSDEQEIIDELHRRGDAHASGPASLPLKEQVRRASRELESGIILRTLQNHRWNRRRAAASLNISYRSLLYKMKLCDLRGDNTTGEVGK
jgi:DNA-binding NtrC family response regulator